MAVIDFGTAGILFGIFGLIETHIARNIPQWPRRLCMALLSAAVASGASSLLVRAAAQGQAPLPLYRALLAAEALTAPLPTLLLFAYILYCCGEDYRKSVSMRVLCACAAVMTAVVCPWELISVAPDYTIQMGQWPVLFWFLSVSLATATLIALLLRWKKLTAAQRVVFLCCLLVPDSTMIILVEFLLMHTLILRYLAQQEESARQRTRLAVAQMRPHFIYNTLLSIYYLCAEDTEKTQRVIRDFSRYLQNNFTAIAEEEPILFSKELEHTRAYLAVEQVCHEGRLFVEFDTPDKYFSVPALTLQPIVENAVKYGLSPGLPPLYVTVATQDTGGGVQITVEDTGPGFQQSVNNEPHIALNNIRQRLKTMCGGTLEIEPREGGGTKVTMFVPRRKE